MTLGLGEFQFRQSQAQVIWKTNVTPQEKPNTVIWETYLNQINVMNCKRDGKLFLNLKAKSKLLQSYLGGAKS